MLRDLILISTGAVITKLTEWSLSFGRSYFRDYIYSYDLTDEQLYRRTNEVVRNLSIFLEQAPIPSPPEVPETPRSEMNDPELEKYYENVRANRHTRMEKAKSRYREEYAESVQLLINEYEKRDLDVDALKHQHKRLTNFHTFERIINELNRLQTELNTG